MAPPKRRQCATMVVDAKLAEAFPSYRSNQDQIEQGIRRSIGTGQALRALRKLLTIDVVVHVVYKLPAENISDAQVKSQIAVLNKDFRATNPDTSKVPAVWKGLVGDPNLKFQLAKKDPAGKATTGITRTATTRDSFGSGNAVKKKAQGGADAWPSDRYLNIWVCNLGDGLLGYAQFPGGPAGDRRRRHPLHRFRHERHRRGAVQPRPHGNARDRPLAEPAPHLGRSQRLRRRPTSSPTRRTSSCRTSASRRSHTSPATTARTATCS